MRATFVQGTKLDPMLMKAEWGTRNFICFSWNVDSIYYLYSTLAPKTVNPTFNLHGRAAAELAYVETGRGMNDEKLLPGQQASVAAALDIAK
jgi:hypothetical protein